MRNTKKQMVTYNPAPIRKTMRRDLSQGLTSFDPGKIVPIAYVPLLREDRVSRFVYDINLGMQETEEKLRNGIHIHARATFIPMLAFERFDGSIDTFNRSYQKALMPDGSAAPILFEFSPWDNEIHRVMGIHGRGGNLLMNDTLLRSYNVMVNDRYARISEKLGDEAKRAEDATTLAAAPWPNSAFAHIVPDYDDARMDNTIPLTGDGRVDIFSTARVTGAAQESFGPAVPAADHTAGDGQDNDADGVREWQDIYGVLRENGIGLNHADLETARRMKAWAQVRSNFSENLSDDHIIDLLMQGNRVPTEVWDKPQVLAVDQGYFGYEQRFATDSGNLDKSVTRGASRLRLVGAMPPTMVNGIILITIEAVPDQVHERKKDHFMHLQDAEQLPNAYLDDLDPHKVAAVANEWVDVDHDDPAGTFGYAPLNHEWDRQSTFIGGKFYRPKVDAAFDEDRQQIWTNETPNPVLSTDFYLATNIHKKPFKFQDEDAFECQIDGGASIVGLTQFGRALQEATGDYEAVMQAFEEEMATRDGETRAAPVVYNPLGQVSQT